jgi:hypothetical protein
VKKPFFTAQCRHEADKTDKRLTTADNWLALAPRSLYHQVRLPRQPKRRYKMVEAKKEPGNILPHNPLTAAGVLAELKKLRGEKSWVQFELELLCKQYPGNTTFKTALDKITTKSKKAQTTTPPGPKGKAANKKEAKQ